jgi:hypothetical protein
MIAQEKIGSSEQRKGVRIGQRRLDIFFWLLDLITGSMPSYVSSAGSFSGSCPFNDQYYLMIMSLAGFVII